jgi:hypothetical protein
MCETVFDNAWARQAIQGCSGSNSNRTLADGTMVCWDIESIEYLGTNAAGDDVYSVKYTNRAVTYTLPQPGPDGKIATRCYFGGPPGAAAVGVRLGGGFCRSSEMMVTSPPSQARILYSRSAEGPTQVSAVTSVTAADRVVVSTTPSGAGDPNAVVCRAPQHITGGNQSGAQVCLHNSEWWKVAMNGKDIAPDGKTLIDRPTVKDPKGEGDPDAITCRTPRFVSGGPLVKVCRLNSFWADVIKNHQVVDARGNVTSPRLNTLNTLDADLPMPGFAFSDPGSSVSQLQSRGGGAEFGHPAATP